MTDLIQEVKAALQAATPGPWEWRKKNFTPGDGEWKDKEFCVGDLQHETKKNSWDAILDVQTNQYGQPDLYCWDEAAAHLIANSPTWLQQLVERLETAERQRDEAVKSLENIQDLIHLVQVDLGIESLAKNTANLITHDITSTLKRIKRAEQAEGHQSTESTQAQAGGRIGGYHE